MRNITCSIAAILVFCLVAALLAPANHSPLVTAQEEETEREERREEDPNEREREEEIDPEGIERRLDEIEELIERAEQRGEEDRIRELRREGERLIDLLEEFERAREEEFEGGEEWEHEIRELEIHRLHNQLLANVLNHQFLKYLLCNLQALYDNDIVL